MWGIEKSLEISSPAEEVEAWRTTVNMLDHLAGMADDLMLEPLSLALVDALVRA